MKSSSLGQLCRYPPLIRRPPLSSLLDGYGVYLTGPAFSCFGPACATASPSPSPIICPAKTNASFSITADVNITYTVIRDIEFVWQNIYPFVLATSFEACLTQCEESNLQNANGSTRCAGFVYAPGRVNDADNCYLKSPLNSPIPATISLIGATLGTATSTTIMLTSTTSTSKFQSSYQTMRGEIEQLQLSLVSTISAPLACTEGSSVQETTGIAAGNQNTQRLLYPTPWRNQKKSNRPVHCAPRRKTYQARIQRSGSRNQLQPDG